MKAALLSLLIGAAAARVVHKPAAVVAASKGSGAAALDANVQYIGRVNPATQELTWPGTGVRFAFEGTAAHIAITSVVGNNSADLIVDGGAPIVIANVDAGSIDTPSGLAQGEHTVELRRRSETDFGTLVLGDVSTDGTLCAPPAPAARQVEFIGDSITVGYGLDGVAPCVNTAAIEDNPATYAALAANAVGADYHVVAWSGKGVVRNYVQPTTDTTPLMTELWTRYGANDTDNSYTFPADWNPAAVVIALGTNDFGYVLSDANGQPYNARDPLDPATYTAATVAFAQTILSHYTNAQVFLVTSPMLNDQFPSTQDMQKTTQTKALQAAVDQLGPNAHLVDWPTQGNETGCDTHPNAATHAAEGAVLADAFRSVLGW